MNIKNISIKTQLKICFTVILILVVILGWVSYHHNTQIHLQTEKIYYHQLKVIIILGEIDKSALSMRMNIRDFLLTENEAEKEKILAEISKNKLRVLEGINALRESYLGPKEDIDNFAEEFDKWVTIRDESVRIALSGRLEDAKLRHKPGGIAPEQAKKVFAAIDKINLFATKKGDSLYNESEKLNGLLKTQLIFLITITFLVSLIMMILLTYNIRYPLIILTETARKFAGGDMNARSLYKSKNEFGALSEAFNILTKTIQDELIFRENASILRSAVLQSVGSYEFQMKVLNPLVEITGSQIGAVYILNDQKTEYVPVESIGMAIENCRPFSALNFEGEFASVILNNDIKIIENIPDNTSFTFAAVSGTFKPAEIITMPLFIKEGIIGIVSLASICKYSPETIRLVKDMKTAFSTGLSAILANKKIRELSQYLESQNQELGAQKQELSMQTEELEEQNVELEMQKNELDQANRLKNTFLSSMSHELRTPLNSVIALSGVLGRRLKGKIGEDEYSYIDVIERNGKQLLLLINDILDISRIEAGKEEVAMSKFSMCKLVLETVETVEPQAVEKDVILKCICDENLPEIHSDYAKCRHIIQNIVANAVKFTDKGSVEVAVKKGDNDILVMVTDSGIGIDSSFLPHIFDEFRQADSTNSRKYGGTGLGLAIAKKQANLIGADISVQSILGKGTSFTVKIPLDIKSQHKNQDIANNEGTLSFIAPKTKEIKAEDKKDKTVLIVEDSEAAIIQMEYILKTEGYRTMTARNGSEAMEKISEKIPDAVVLDLMMPDIDGFEVLKRIRGKEKTARLPVMILTAKYISKDELSFLKYNQIHQIVQKGDVNKNQLLKTIEQMVFPVNTPTESVDRINLSNKKDKKPRILIVEDNVDNMITAKAILGEEFEIVEAYDGPEGVAQAKKWIPDLILMDIALPGMNGIETLKEIKKDEIFQNTPVIAVTASAMKGDMENLINYGFNGYVSKPLNEKIFMTAVKEAVYGKQ